jgi:GT2 family glycosyltransferase
MTTGPMPALSVIVGCRDAADTLGETLEAVAAQAYPGWWEVVVVDNGSSDGTADVARAMATRLPNLRVLRPDDPGHQARGLNHGIEHAKGEVLAFLDADDVIGPDYLLHMGRALAGHPFAGGRVDVALLNPPEVRSRRPPLQAERIDEFCGFRPAVIGAAMGARRDALVAVGGMDPALPTQHDLDVSWRLAEAGLPAVFVPDAVLHYRYRSTAAEIFRQERGYGVGEVVLFQKFRSRGMPRRDPLRVAAAYLRLLRTLPGLHTPPGRAKAATMAGLLLGRLQGSLRQRILYL